MALLISPLSDSAPQKGARISASWLDRLQKFVAQNTIRSISGGTLKRNPDGIDLIVPQRQNPTRVYVAYGTANVDVTGGAVCSLANLAQDHNAATQLNMELGTLATNQFTFTKEGQFLLTYHASFTLNVGEATTHVPSVVTCQSYLRAGGTELPGSKHKTDAVQIPNFSDFVKTSGGALTLSTDISGATGLTDAFTTQEDVPFSFYPSGGYLTSVATTVDLLTPSGLDGANKMPVTLDTQTAITADTNASAIAAYTPEDYVHGATSGTAIIKVIRNTSGVLKIELAGPTEVSPVIDLFATGAGGLEVICVANSISIQHIS